MPYTTVVAGTTITAAYGNANIRDQVVTPFASAAARTSAISSPVAGMVSALTDTGRLDGYDGAAWQLAAFYPSVLIGRSTADQSVTSSTTFVDATNLSVSIAANGIYELTCRLWQQAGTAGDFKGQFSQPAGCTHTYTPMGFNTGASSGVPDQVVYMLKLTDASWSSGGAAGPLLILVQGIIVNGANAGTFKLQFAQNTSDASATTLQQQSHIVLRRVG